MGASPIGATQTATVALVGFSDPDVPKKASSSAVELLRPLRPYLVHPLRYLSRHGAWGSLQRVRGSVLAPVIDASADLVFDFKHGTDTSTIASANDLDYRDEPNHVNASRYRPISPRWVTPALEYLRVHDAAALNGWFVDFGCGAGPVMIIAAELGWKQVTGVELSPSLVRLCRQNLSQYSKQHPGVHFEVVEQDAVALPIRADAQVFFFEPFAPSIYEIVLERIPSSLRSSPRSAYLLDVGSRVDFQSRGFRPLAYSRGTRIFVGPGTA